MDTFASLALATDKPTNLLLQRPPVKQTESILTPNMWRNVFGQGLYQIIVLCLILFKFPAWFAYADSEGSGAPAAASADSAPSGELSLNQLKISSIFFHSFVLMQVFNEINARKLLRADINVFSGLTGNPLFWMIILFSLLIQFSMILFGGTYIGITQLSANEHLICLAIGFGSIVQGVIIKILPNQFFNKIKLFKEEELDKF